jgi:hypothetical protein
MFKKISASIVLFFLVFLFGFSGVKAAEDQTLPIDSTKAIIHLFWAEGCPHCESEKEFLVGLGEEGVQFQLAEYEVSRNKESVHLLEAVGQELETSISNVPFTVIGDQYMIGYLNDESSGAELIRLLDLAEENKENGQYVDLVEQIKVGGIVSSEAEFKPESKPEDKDIRILPEKLDLPIFGKVNLKTVSLPLLTFFIAFLDGFNPCAMWTLLFLISLLLGMKDRKRMWLLGTTFIVTSGFVYFLFMSAWLNLFLFLGFIVWVRIMVGLAALGTGGYYLRDFWKNKDGACSLEDNEKKQETFAKLKKIALKESLWLALGGIIMLAFAVNLVELICSAGLPAIYTQILSSSNLPAWQYYAYLAFYIFIFMLDDLVVFMIAMLTLQAVGLNSKYARFSHLIGGILMFIIGLLMIFKPELLMFG